MYSAVSSVTYKQKIAPLQNIISEYYFCNSAKEISNNKSWF